MGDMVPSSKPNLQLEDVTQYLTSVDAAKYPVRLLGLRGYYKKSMGDPTKNDIGIYDDAMCVVTPKGIRTFNFNTDPSKHGVKMAHLVPGTYLYKIGMHNMKNPYKALRQYGRITVLREGVNHTDTDTADAPFYIDIHKGGYNTTSSLGCQTIHPDQWPEFLQLVEDLLKKYNQTIIPYTLVEN